MATWVRAQNRKLNLDQAAFVDRTENGDVYVVYDGAINHRFTGAAADRVWDMIVARDTEPAPSRMAAADGAPRTRRRSRAS